MIHAPRASEDGLQLLAERQITPRVFQEAAVPREPALLRVVHGAVHPLQPPTEVLAETSSDEGTRTGSGTETGKKVRM